MNIGRHKLILVIGSLVAFLILATALISSYWPEYETQFIELGLLGKNKLASDYFSDANSTVSIGSQVNWYIYLHNHMVNPQNVIIKVKLLNSTMKVPNDQDHEPSPFTPFTELSFFLSRNETLIVPFSWSISEIVLEDDSIMLNRLTYNDQTVRVDVSTLSSSFFRMVFELWVYDQFSQEYQFGWNSAEGFSSVSLSIGFRVSKIVI